MNVCETSGRVLSLRSSSRFLLAASEAPSGTISSSRKNGLESSSAFPGIYALKVCSGVKAYLISSGLALHMGHFLWSSPGIFSEVAMQPRSKQWPHGMRTAVSEERDSRHMGQRGGDSDRDSGCDVSII